MSTPKPAPIPMSAKRTDVFTPPSLEAQEIDGEKVGGERELSFVLRVPTPSERDTIGTRLFEMGLTAVSQEQLRAVLVDELFKLDWTNAGLDGSAVALSDAMLDAGVEAFAGLAADALPRDIAESLFQAMIAKRTEQIADNEAIGDEHAEFLDGYWTRQSTEEHATILWQEQEAQRLLDEGAGAPPRAPTPMPARQIKPREHAKAKLLIDDVMDRSPRLRSLSARQMDYGRQNAQLMVRLHVMSIGADNVRGPIPDIQLHRDQTGLLTVDVVDEIREYIGERAWGELVSRIDGHYSLSETERKNSDSPPEKPSLPNGSPEPSGGSETSGGKSTGSSITPAQTAESETITGKSSDTPSGEEAPKKKRGRTEKD